MDWRRFFYLSRLKAVILIVTFVVIFFINFQALFNPCNWKLVCPDFIRESIVSLYPNFYRPAGCGYGIAYICWKASLSLKVLLYDVLSWAMLNVAVFCVIHKLRKQL